jgi:hypothetical protein
MPTAQRGGNLRAVPGAPSTRRVARLGLVGILKEILAAGSWCIWGCLC